MQVATGLVTSVFVQDIHGATTTATGIANIADAPLVASSPILVSAVEGLSFTTTIATFTDTNPFGTLAQFSAVINWGDGTSSPRCDRCPIGREIRCHRHPRI